MRYDLTRWNRAGLKKFRYVDGNAATYLEDLRQDLLKKFPAWAALDADIPPDETTEKKNLRIETQYGKIRREWGWEIARSLARSAHVLTEYIDAYANEGYLETATQWENVRRLVEMIGYHPGPPASASTPIVILAKAGKNGTVEAGFQVFHTPEKGTPVVFETLDDIDVDAELNELRLDSWDWSPALLSGAVWQLDEDQEVSAGALALLVNVQTAERYVVRIASVDTQDRLTLTATHADDDWSAWKGGDAMLLFDPAVIQKPRLNGAGVIHLPEGHGLSARNRIAWQQGATWRYDIVTAADAQSVRLASGTLPGVGVSLYRVQKIDADSSGVLRFPAQYRNISTTGSGAASAPSGSLITTRTPEPNDYEFTGSYKEIDASAGIGTLYMVPQDVAAVTTVIASPPAGEFLFPGSPGDLAGGDIVIGQTGSSQYDALEVKEVIRREADFSVTFVTPPASLLRLHGPMKEVLRPVGYTFNSTALGTPLALEAPAGGSLSGLLKTGRRVILEQVDQTGAFAKAWSSKLTSVDLATGAVTLEKMPPATDGYTLGNTIVRANVVMAGHGETKPAKVLGSGDATQSFQEFVLAEKDVAFVADSSMASGVAAALDLTVGGERWQQVSTLDDSDPADPHYTARLTEEGHVRIAFGDGQHGRRLPTGTGNVRVIYRTGTGSSGNLPAGSLAKPVKPHLLVDKVRQPAASTGGNDREPVSSLRANAPAALFTLDRAVSVEDYARLAERNSSVWQARAFRLPNQGAQQERIRVVVVPAGGGELGDLAGTLQKYLEAHDLPGTRVEIMNHVPVPFDLDITVQVDGSQYAHEDVRAAVEEAVYAAFALRERRLGQPIYPSEVIAVVESVEGVINSRCLLGDAAFSAVTPAPRVLKSGSGQIRLVQPGPEQVMVLDKSASTVTIQTKEFAI